MNIILYHESTPESVDAILENGIKREASGAKRDSHIEMIDTFLDTHASDRIKAAGLSRRGVTYAFMEHDGKIVDIATGESVPVSGFRKGNGMRLLRLTVDAGDCFVSDLDLYDTLKRAMELDEQGSTREHLAERYWERVVPFTQFEFGSIKRPEVMIRADIDPGSIEAIEK